MLLALQDIGFAETLKFVGFDASAVLVAALGKRELDGIVVQNPMRMGYLGVRAIASHLNGVLVEALIDTGVALVTLDNMDSADAQALLDPPIQRYLAGQ